MDNNNISYKELLNINNIKASIVSSSDRDSNINYYYDSSNIRWCFNDAIIKEIIHMYHVVSNNININQLNDIIDNELEFYFNSSLDNNHIEYP